MPEVRQRTYALEYAMTPSLQDILDQAVRDITKVGVMPAPKSKVREVLLPFLERAFSSGQADAARRGLEDVEQGREVVERTGPIIGSSKDYLAGFDNAVQTVKEALTPFIK